MVRFLLDAGIQTFAVSWRNPTVEHRDWGIDTYVAALDEAVDAARSITGSDDVSMMGSCSGGITAAAYVATLGLEKVRNLVLAVCLLDTGTADDSAFGSLITPETMRAAKQASQLRGVLDGQDLARMFAWMRPNDLIYTDASGDAEMNTKLSEDRAKAVITYLVQQGSIPVRHIVAPGAMGEYGAKAPNETKAGRAENRRVEVKVLVNKGIAGS